MRLEERLARWGEPTGETETLCQVLRANRAFQKSATIVIDNLATFDTAKRITALEPALPAWTFGKWLPIAKMLHKQSVRIAWVPSHGKRESWKPSIARAGTGV